MIDFRFFSTIFFLFAVKSDIAKLNHCFANSVGDPYFS